MKKEKTVGTAGAETTFLGDGLGYTRSKKGDVVMFTIDGLSDDEQERLDSYRKLYRPYTGENVCVTVGGYHVPIWGEYHNLYPQEVDALIRENKLLPGILRKQEDFLYGHGPYLYQEQIVDGKKIRVPVEDEQIQNWLDSWEKYGVDSYEDYLRQLISDYYRVRTCVTQYHFARGRVIPAMQRGSILALSYVGADEARLAMEENPIHKRVKQADCTFVAVGDWMLRTNGVDFEIYNRLDPANPFKYPNAIAFNSSKSFGKWVYAYNEWFAGLREWVKASNLTPRYLNSYLKNALNAHVHVKIPQAWVATHTDILKSMCIQNLATKSEKWVYEYRGVKLVDPEKKQPYAFNQNMVDDLIANELEKITNLLSGEGKNQGKLYATTKVGQEGWEFVEFPSKFKDYFESVISYDKRADQVTLAGIGINSSITNVENDGVISKSGADVYYNYVVYLNALSYPEKFVCREINRAIQLNFPHAVEQNIKLGFRIEVPVKQQDTTPSDRITEKQPVG